MSVTALDQDLRETMASDLATVRARTLALTASLADADLERQIDPIMSPLAWDLAHIAAYEDLWLVHRHAGRALVHPELAATYDAFETPRAVRGDIELLTAAEARDYLADVREHALAAIASHGVDPVVHGMVLRHEQQHTETMLQCLMLARLAGYEPPRQGADPVAPGGHTGLERLPVPGGRVPLGAPADRFSFDNERPRHMVEVAPFRIARTLVTNATWLHFVEGGGYRRREWWSDEAWSWKEEYDITHPMHWERRGDGWVEHALGGPRDLDPDRPVAHVSWFEAAAFARAHGARLPTEAEWETAATWTQPRRSRDAALAPGRYDTSPVGAHPEGAADCGALDLIGNLWEWTSTDFGGYPGFEAHPYREYSEVFFGSDHRVLRGGSWATQSEVATPTFRNWDLPQRRQIFAGVRLAWDEEAR
jgi:iron(II)-dependent oxidoreductase